MGIATSAPLFDENGDLKTHQSSPSSIINEPCSCYRLLEYPRLLIVPSNTNRTPVLTASSCEFEEEEEDEHDEVEKVEEDVDSLQESEQQPQQKPKMSLHEQERQQHQQEQDEGELFSTWSGSLGTPRQRKPRRVYHLYETDSTLMVPIDVDDYDDIATATTTAASSSSNKSTIPFRRCRRRTCSCCSNGSSSATTTTADLSSNSSSQRRRQQKQDHKDEVDQNLLGLSVLPRHTADAYQLLCNQISDVTEFSTNSSSSAASYYSRQNTSTSLCSNSKPNHHSLTTPTALHSAAAGPAKPPRLPQRRRQPQRTSSSSAAQNRNSNCLFHQEVPPRRSKSASTSRLRARSEEFDILPHSSFSLDVSSPPSPFGPSASTTATTTSSSKQRQPKARSQSSGVETPRQYYSSFYVEEASSSSSTAGNGRTSASFLANSSTTMAAASPPTATKDSKPSGVQRRKARARSEHIVDFPGNDNHGKTITATNLRRKRASSSPNYHRCNPVSQLLLKAESSSSLETTETASTSTTNNATKNTNKHTQQKHTLPSSDSASTSDTKMKAGTPSSDVSTLPNSPTSVLHHQFPIEPSSPTDGPATPPSVFTDVTTNSSYDSSSSSNVTQKAESLMYQGRYTEARTEYRRLLTTLRHRISPHTKADLYHQIAWTHYQESHYLAGLCVIKHALEVMQMVHGCLTFDDLIRSTLSNKSNGTGTRTATCQIADLILTEAKMYTSLDDVEQSKRLAKIALSILKQKQNCDDATSQIIFAKTQLVLGKACAMAAARSSRINSNSNKSKADSDEQNIMHHYHQALQIFSYYHEHAYVAETIHLIGEACPAPELANPSYNQSLLIQYHQHQHDQSQDDIATTLARLGWNALVQGHLDTAMQYTLQALERTTIPRNVASVHFQMGLIYSQLGDASEALRKFKKTLKMHRTVFAGAANQHIDTARTCEVIAMEYQRLGRFERSRDFLEGALEIYAQPEDVARIHSRLAYHFVNYEKDPSRAKRAWNKASRIYKGKQIPIDNAGRQAKMAVSIFKTKQHKD